MKNKGWITESIEKQKQDPTFRGYIIEDWHSSDQINFDGERAADAEFYIVRWQAAPVVVRAPYGTCCEFDALSHSTCQTRWDAHSWNAVQESFIGHAMKPVLEKQGVVISTSYNIDETNVLGLQDFVGDVKRATQPAVEIYSPVIENMYDQVIAVGQNKSSLVAILGLSIFWQDLIEGILPIGNEGLVAVFDNAACNQTFTFQINGPQAIYLGSGDLHESAYDHLMVSSSLSGLAHFSSNDQAYTGPSVNEDFCPYSLRLYSSLTMEKDHITSKPTIFAFVSVFICEY
jgi:hypothetical protein